jgi:DeoR/GlpR family transcriptional regulator of sugar metabolism
MLVKVFFTYKFDHITKSKNRILIIKHKIFNRELFLFLVKIKNIEIIVSNERLISKVPIFSKTNQFLIKLLFLSSKLSYLLKT